MEGNLIQGNCYLSPPYFVHLSLLSAPLHLLLLSSIPLCLIPLQVLCVAWHPLVTGVVAFGTEDGTVGCSDISHTPPAIASWGQRHAGPVAELSWHPSEGWGREERREEAEEVAETDRSEGPASSAGPLLRLFSVGADGSLLEWPALRLAALRAGQANGRLQGEPLAVAVGPAEALELPYTSGRISTFDWDASGEAVAVGCSDGSVAVLWRLRHAGWWRWAPSGAQVQRHSRGINAVRWAPGESSLLAAAGDDGAVSVLAWRSLGVRGL